MKLIKIFILIFIIIGMSIFINYRNFINTTLNENKVINVKSGDNLTTILTKNINLSKFYLKIYLNLNPEKKINLQVGEYRFLKGENIESIIKTFSYGAKTKDEKLVILEGWNIFDIDEYLYKKGFIKAKEFISEAKNIEKYKKNFIFLKNALSLEGYLYPDTYFVQPNNFSVEEFNKIMLNNFNLKIYIPFLSHLKEKEINEIITIASILEKEEKNINEKSIVAGILKKRYKEKWMIGADITACYAYELTSEECKLNLQKYIFEKNDYNTRTMTGLPKTPINNPQISSIEATLNPKITPYYYYLHDTTTGKIYYAKTNEEHIKNKEIYIKK